MGKASKKNVSKKLKSVATAVSAAPGKDQPQIANAEETKEILRIQSMMKGLSPIDAMKLKFHLLGKDQHWWIMDESVEVIRAELKKKNFAVIPGFLLDDQCHELRAHIDGAHREGRLGPGALAGGVTGENLSYTIQNVRGDQVGWFEGETEDWSILTEHLRFVDTLVSLLGEDGPGADGKRALQDLSTIGSRSQAMCTIYPGDGARYVKHTDNSCNVAAGGATGRGESCNGRRLTTILYLNEGWVEAHGGTLRIFEPEDPDALLAEVEPKLGNLLLFWADRRCPHEVTPASRDRYAVTVWYFDGPERQRAQEKGFSADEEDIRKREKEKERIAGEIRNFEAKYGAEATLRKQNDHKQWQDKPGSGGQIDDIEAASSSEQDAKIDPKTDGAAVEMALTVGRGPATPQHTVAEVIGPTGQLLIEVTVDLPRVEGIGDVDLDIEDDVLELEADGVYQLRAKLPHGVDLDTILAKFDKASKRLVVTAAILIKVAGAGR